MPLRSRAVPIDAYSEFGKILVTHSKLRESQITRHRVDPVREVYDRQTIGLQIGVQSP